MNSFQVILQKKCIEIWPESHLWLTLKLTNSIWSLPLSFLTARTKNSIMRHFMHHHGIFHYIQCQPRIDLVLMLFKQQIQTWWESDGLLPIESLQ